MVRIPPYGVHVLEKHSVVQKGRDHYLREAKRLLREVDVPKRPAPPPLGKFPGQVTVAVRFAWEHHADTSVFLAGSFNRWGLPVAMTQVGEQWQCVLRLAFGVYEYKFVVDGEWAVDASRLCVASSSRGIVNRVIVDAIEPS